MADVLLSNVSQSYRARGGPVHALRAINLHVADGELLTIVGRSGSGKTTLLRVIAGLERIAAGEIRIDGRMVTDLPPRKRDVAMVFQSLAMYEHLSVRRNLATPLRLRGVGRAEVARRIQAVAAMLRIESWLDRRPGTLSGGQRQRAALARAIVVQPTCLLLDEPLSHLDRPLRLAMRHELRDLQRRHRWTMLHVTHDPEEALALGDRVAVLCEGTLLQVAPPRELLEQPATRAVAELFGSADDAGAVARIKLDSL